ncbi:MAG: DUF790 family protein [Candidatus Odinarchaeota archaeon]
MSGNLNIMDFILKKDKNSSLFVPFLFKIDQNYSEEISSLERLLGYLREKKRIKVVDFNYDEYIDFFSNKKLGQVFTALLIKPPLCEILSEFPKEENSEELLYESWIEVNKTYDGFCNSIYDQNTVFQVVKKRLTDRALVLERVMELKSLYQDHANQQVFSFRLEDVTSEELLISYNKAFFQALLKVSNSIEFLMDTQHIPGEFYKKVFWKSRGLLVDYTLVDEKLLLKITGPKELVGRHVRYNRALVQAFFEIIRLIYQYSYKTMIYVSIDFLNRKRTVQIPVVTGKILFFSKYETEEKFTDETRVFDSNVERSFYEAFSHFSSRWKLKREPEVLFLEETVIIPDFTIYWKDMKIYVEIVGFWTSKYLNKKFIKLRKLSTTNIEFLVLVDSNLKMGSTGLPTFFYKGLKFPLQEIITFLDNNYYKKAFRTHKNRKISEIVCNSSLNDYLSCKKTVENEELLAILEITEIRELDDFLTNKNLLEYIERLGFMVIPQFGVVNKNYFEKLKESISFELEKSFNNEDIESKGLDYNNFIKNFEVDEKLLKQLIEFSGYDITWVSLVKRLIRKKKGEM